MRTKAQKFGARNSITKVMVTMVLIAIPTAGVGVSAPGSAPNTPARYGALPAPPPADPPTDTPQPPPPPPPPPPPAGGYNGDYYCGSCGSQAGGGGGG
jgi:hypothetical protein